MVCEQSRGDGFNVNQPEAIGFLFFVRFIFRFWKIWLTEKIGCGIIL